MVRLDLSAAPFTFGKASPISLVVWMVADIWCGAGSIDFLVMRIFVADL